MLRWFFGIWIELASIAPGVFLIFMLWPSQCGQTMEMKCVMSALGRLEALFNCLEDCNIVEMQSYLERYDWDEIVCGKTVGLLFPK